MVLPAPNGDNMCGGLEKRGNAKLPLLVEDSENLGLGANCGPFANSAVLDLAQEGVDKGQVEAENGS